MEKYAFISDLDDYFCEKYANYDRMCVLKGYVMPKMQTTQRREDGTDYSYTLPPETMRLSLQENKAALLKQLKERMCDYTFSFSFRPLGFFEKLRCNRSKYSFKKVFAGICAKYSVTSEQALGVTDIGEKTNPERGVLSHEKSDFHAGAGMRVFDGGYRNSDGCLQREFRLRDCERRGGFVSAGESRA